MAGSRGRQRRRAAWLGVALVLGTASAMSAAAGSVFGNGKGVANSGAVAFKRAGGAGSPAAYEALPERFSPAVLDQIRAAGFGHIRLMATAEPLLTDDASALERAVAWLSARVDQATAKGLSVVLDVHPWASVDSPFHQDAIIADRGKREALMRAQVALARALQAKAGKPVALELLNEPPCTPGEAPRDWNIAQREMVTRIRKVAPTLPLILKSCRDHVDTLVELDPRSYARDPNIYWSFHYYQPSSFVEQSQKKLDRVPFPPDPSLANSPTALHRMAPAATVLTNPRTLVELREYLRDGRGRATIAADFDRVAIWARRHGIAPGRIWLGEWGALIQIGPAGEAVRADSLRYLATVRQEAERRGFAWANFGIGEVNINFDPETRFIRDDAQEALGLTGRSTAIR